MTYAPEDLKAVMRRIADAVHMRIVVHELTPVSTAELDNGFEFARGERIVKLADMPGSHARIMVLGGHGMPVPVDLQRQFSPGVIENAAAMILDRLDDHFQWT